MNSFDLLIERYKKELIDAKRRSIEKEIVESFAEPVPEAMPAVSKVEPVFQEEAEPAGLEAEPEPVQVFENSGIIEEMEEDFLREPLGLSNPLEKLSDGSEDDTVNPEEAEPDFMSEEESNENGFLSNDSEEEFPESIGSLKVQVFMANRVYPVSSAHVVITGKDNKKVYFDGYTDTNGVVGKLFLPAPKKSLSQSPQEKPPYSQYDITVSHPKFQTRKYLGVPVFSGVESIQNINLLPLGTDETDNTDVTESEPNELLKKGVGSNA